MSSLIYAIFSIFVGEIMVVKDRIKQLCKSNGITVDALEKTLGLAKGYVSKMGTGANTAKVRLIAEYFDVSVDYLLTGEMPSYSPEGARIAAESMFNPRLSAINEMFLELSPERQADIYNYAKMIYENEKKGK